MAKNQVKLSKNARAGMRGATETLTPHVCPICHEHVSQKQLVVVLHYPNGRRGRTQGYHSGCVGLRSEPA
jgi:hypothetical protein